MARFEAPKGYHFSEDGTDKTTWAHFTKVPDSNPAVYAFETTKPAQVTKLRKLSESDDSDITEIEVKARRGKAPTPDGTGQSEGDGGQSEGEGGQPEGNGGEGQSEA